MLASCIFRNIEGKCITCHDCTPGLQDLFSRCTPVTKPWAWIPVTMSSFQNQSFVLALFWSVHVSCGALTFFCFLFQVCSAFTVEQGIYNHVKIHHAYTNVIGLGDSSSWKLPFLNRYVYMFIAPIAIPILTPLVALGMLFSSEFFISCCLGNNFRGIFFNITISWTGPKM